MSQGEVFGSLLNLISGFFSGFNWVDILIFFIFAFYILEGYAVGFISGLRDFLSFFFSFLAALKYYPLMAVLLAKTFSISMGFSNALSFMLTAIISEFIISVLLKRFVVTALSRNISAGSQIKNINSYLGIVPGFLSSLIIVTFFLTLFISLPLSPSLKNYIFNSKIGNFLVSNTQGFEKILNGVFGGAVSDTLNFLTIEPKSNESLNLHFTTNKFSIDKAAEQQMLVLVNQEREKRGIGKLSFDDALEEVGALHCKDMFERGYFSHYTPEGFSPFDRMDKADVYYSYAGENLALAPSVVTAMQGFMQSPGHKENILSANFGRVGIAAVDGGMYGIMFCQEFTD